MSEYAFAGDKPERLAGIEATWDPGTIERLEALGVGPGWRCLEVGAGGGSIAAWMAARIGEHGRVLATDIDTTFLEPLARDNLEVRRHDLLAEELPADAFDLVHVRLLLEWLGDSDALERLVKAAAPGGWVVVEDFDWAIGGPIDDSSPVLTKGLDAILGLLERIGYQRFLGRTLLRRFEQVGLTEIGNDARAYVLHGGSPGTAFHRFSFESQRQRLVESDLMTADEIEETLRELNNPERHVVTSMMFAAWGRKPV
jgi:SAM-dependent methyltransferase